MYFSPKISESLTLKFAQAVRERNARGEKILSLGIGEPDFPTPTDIINSTIQVLKKGNSTYSNPLGIPALRKTLAKKLKTENYINVTSENIFVTPGAKQAFQLITMALLEPKDEVILIMPSYVSYIPQIYISEPDVIIHQYDINKEDFSLDIYAIEKLINNKTKCIVINSPQNPTGVVFSREQLKSLFLLAEKHSFYIISDEVYEKLCFSNREHVSIGSFEKDINRVFTINGFSKSHAMTGWRIGYATFPSKFRNKILKLQQHINTNTCTFIQEALVEVNLLEDTHIINYNNILKNRVILLNDAIDKMKNISCVIPQGSFFAFINISKLDIDSNLFCAKLIDKTGVALTPGIAFGENWDDHVRISLAVDDLILKEGLKRLITFIKDLEND